MTMNLNDIQENQLVERYLQGRLSAHEQQEFEELYLARPELLAELELAEKLQQGLQDVAASGFESKYGASGPFQSLLRSPQYSMAASVLMLFAFGLSGVLYQQLQTTDLTAADQFLPMATATRSGPGAEPANLVRIENRQTWADSTVNLGVDQGFETYAVYRATVSRETPDGSLEVFRIVGLQPGRGLPPGFEEMLSIGIPGQVLPPGDYRILLEGSPVEADGQFQKISVTRFRVSE
jgi:hypothetical protein